MYMSFGIKGLMWILKENVIYWCNRRLITKLYVDESVKIRMDEGEIRSMKIGKGVRQGRYGCTISLRLRCIQSIS